MKPHLRRKNEWAAGAPGHDIALMSEGREILGFAVHSRPMVRLGLHVTCQLSHAGFDPGNARLNGYGELADVHLEISR